MLHTPLAKHLPHVSKLVFGCMGLGGGWNKDAITDAHVKQAHECIDSAIEGGINFFDHADIYTFGKAELPKTSRGDYLMIRSAGAYGQVLSSKYNLRDFAQAVYSDDFALNAYVAENSRKLVLQEA